METPPGKAKTDVASLNAQQLRNLKAKSDLQLKGRATEFAITLLKFCVGFVAVACVLEFVCSFLPHEQMENGAKDLLGILQYIMAGLVGFSFGQSSAKD